MHGEPAIDRIPAEVLIEMRKRLKLEKQKNGCIYCTSHKSAIRKYPKIYFGKLAVFVHTLLWVARYGDIPEGYKLISTCKDYQCCNPEHWELNLNPQNLEKEKKKRKKASARQREALAFRMIRESLGLSAIKLAPMLGYSANSIYKWGNGGAKIPDKVALALIELSKEIQTNNNVLIPFITKAESSTELMLQTSLTVIKWNKGLSMMEEATVMMNSAKMDLQMFPPMLSKKIRPSMTKKRKHE